MNKKLIANIIHTLFLIALVVLVWVKVHWSVAVFCAWLSLSVYVLVSMQIRLHREYIRKLKQVREEGQQTVREFNAFVDTINQQAEKVKKEMNTCRECEQHPGVVRPGSTHNGNAENCQIGQKLKAPPPVLPMDSLAKEFKPCQLCVTEGNKGTEFKNGNCPIHN